MAEPTALAPLDPNFRPPNIPEDQWLALTDDEKRELAAFYQSEIEESKEGIDLKMPRIKISKDTLSFVNELGESAKELRGVVVFKHKTRSLYHKDHGREDNRPTCSSLDGKYGHIPDDEEGRAAAMALGLVDGQACAKCPFNQWGTGVDDAGKPTGEGKYCKEKRRAFIVERNAAIPALINFPTSSINTFDEHFSGRLNRGIIDLSHEVVATLREEKRGKFAYAVAEFEVGDPVDPRTMLKLREMRDKVKETAVHIAVEEDDADDGAIDTADEAYG